MADRTGAETRRAIIDTAARVFREKGYDSATLGEIAEELDITRSAVLHHFESKEALLREVVTPLIRAVDALLDRREAAGQLTARTRRPFLVELVDIVCDHPDAAAIVASDAGIRYRMADDLEIASRATRLATMATVNQDDPFAALRAFCALGAMVRPAYAPPGMIDLADPAVRRVIVDCAVAVYGTAPSAKAASGSADGLQPETATTPD